MTTHRNNIIPVVIIQSSQNGLRVSAKFLMAHFAGVMSLLDIAMVNRALF